MESASETDKECIVCLERKPLSGFYRRRDSPDGHRNDCKDCNNERSRQAYIKSGRVKTNHYKHFGITLEEYLVLRKQRQEAECEICGATDNLHIDHCHERIKVRGFLCSNCNTAIGLLGEDVERMLSAIDYIKKHSN